MDLVDVIVKNRQAIKDACARHGATTVRVFGSCARNDYDERSDIDVLIRIPSEIHGFGYFGTLGAIQDELTALLGVKVDVVDEASLKGRSRERILKEAVSL